MSFRTLHNKLEQKAIGVYDHLEAYVYRMSLNHVGISSFFIKLFINVAIFFVTLTPIWTGLAIYLFIIWIAGLLGIAVIAVKIVVFTLLLITLGRLQFAMGLLGVTAAVLVTLA